MSEKIVEAITEQWGERCPDFDADCACCQVWAEYDAITAALAVAPKPTHRHKKRGSEYVLLGYGKMQTASWREPMASTTTGAVPVDMHAVAIYRSVDDGALWVRPREEFEDGRFEALSALEDQS